MGSIILNKLEDSEEFKFFKRVFNTGDKIFMVSSIFGGTGASGFPLLLKNLQTAGDNIQKAVKGAVSVMPYFKLNENGESYIDSNSFITKTKAALSFYEGQLKGVDELYYIADSQLAMHNNDETKQENASHLVEMMSAMGIIDFADSTKRYDLGVASTLRDGNFHECAINGNRNELSLYDLDDHTKALVHKPLIKNLFLSYIYNNLGPSSSSQPWFIEALGDQHEQAFKKGNGEFEPLVKFLKDYNNWIKELGVKERKFLPFDVSQDINEWVVNHGSVMKKGLMDKIIPKRLSDDKINVILNSQIRKVQKDEKGFDRVLELMDKATDVIYQDYFRI